MRDRIKEATTIVVKMGTTSVTHANGTLDLRKLDHIARVLTDLENNGKKIVLVSSGAIGAGMNRLEMSERPKTLKEKQAAASVGQGLLMQIYHKFFDEYNQNVGQILLTKDVFKHSLKRNNVKNTFSALIEMGVIPIVNENDCIATDEILEECFGDNDILSAMTAEIIEADLLVILSDVDGFYDENPLTNKNARMIKTVPKVDNKTMQSAGATGSCLGTGGMVTKLGAAKFVTSRGIDMIIASGDDCTILYDLLDGKELGTLFLRKDKRDAML